MSKKNTTPKKFAILIGVFHNDQRQPSVKAEIEELKCVLGDPEGGNFDVKTLLNPELMNAKKAISRISQQAGPQDVVFFHFIGEAEKGRETDSLFLLFSNSDRDFLEATAMDSEFIVSQFRKSKCKNFILIVDCAYASAFFNNNRGLPRGLFALTASDEGRNVGKEGHTLTSIILKGLQEDEVDRDRDGKITFSELFDYVIDTTKSANKNIDIDIGIPQKWEWNVDNNICFYDRPKKVFISYRHNSREFVEKLATGLNAQGIDTFVDKRNLQAGDQWKDLIEREIQRSRALIAVLEPMIFQSKPSMIEFEAALSKDIPIIPIEIEPIEPSALFELRYGHYHRDPFNQNDFPSELEKLANRIRTLHKPTANAPEQPLKDTVAAEKTH